MTEDFYSKNGDLLAGLNRSNLEKMTLRPMRPGKPWQPDLFLVQMNGRLGVVKDYSKRPWLYRVAVGWISARREEIFYGKLQGVPGIPQFLGRLDRYALAMEYIPGSSASRVPPGVVGPEFFEKLDRVLDQVHQKGIVLCDLRHISNIVISEKGEPYLLDFCTAFERGSRWNILKRGLYHLFYQDDKPQVSQPPGKHRDPILIGDTDQCPFGHNISLY